MQLTSRVLWKPRRPLQISDSHTELESPMYPSPWMPYCVQQSPANICCYQHLHNYCSRSTTRKMLKYFLICTILLVNGILYLTMNTKCIIRKLNHREIVLLNCKMKIWTKTTTNFQYRFSRIPEININKCRHSSRLSK